MTLKEALHVVLNEEYLRDFIYTVRDRVFGSDPGFKGSSWDHPRVIRFSDAVKRLEEELK